MTHSDKISDEWTPPPVDGLEVVGYQYRFEMWNGDWSEWASGGVEKPTAPDLEVRPLVTLSQASSVIAGLKEEKTYWWEKANEENGLRVHLEEENKRLREALKPFAFQGLRVDLDRFDGETQIEVRFPRVSPRKAIPCGFVYVEDVLTARQALEQTNG